MEIGKVIKKYRIDQNVKQEDMAKAFGVTPQAVSRWENEISYPDITIVPMIAKFLKVSTDTLLGYNELYELNQNSILNQSQIDSIFDYIPSPTGKKRNILVVDDADFMRMTLQDILTSDGHSVLLAKDGTECLNLLKTHSIDMCILDIIMPGIHGLEVLKYLKENYPDLIVIMLSAQSLESNVRTALSLGANGFVAKPFQPNTILERM